MKRDSKTIKIAVGAMLTALSIVLPQVFHLTGIPQVGSIFLPMHIPVLLAGFMLGPVYASIIGALAPVISHLLTNMPAAARLPFMIVELLVYGLASGLFYHVFRLKEKRFGAVITLALSMLAGRLVYALALVVAAEFFGIEGGFMAAVTATVSGVYGIVLQFITIPPIVFACKKGGFIK
ncbi:MAG: ECF transporter S component [Clostridia bacterium]|nr:ECF transporter S component [Clostridia bacterium]